MSTHVLALALPYVPSDAKTFGYKALTDVFVESGGECAYVLVGRDNIAKLSRKVSSESVLLVGLDHRPTADESQRWTQRFGSNRASVMLSDRVWSFDTDTFEVHDVSPNRQRIALTPSQQAMYDIAVAHDFRRSLVRHHPVDVGQKFKDRGFDANISRTTTTPDQRVAAYDALLRLPSQMMNPRSLRAVGRHSRFSGLMVPVASMGRAA